MNLLYKKQPTRWWVAGLALGLLGFLFWSGRAQQQAEVWLEPAWESEPVLATAESALYDSLHEVIYVSCINGGAAEKNGKGYIARLDLSGKVLDSLVYGALNAPKGMALTPEGLLVTTDIDELVWIDPEENRVVMRKPVATAAFLNDLTIDATGTLYVSDSKTNQLYYGVESDTFRIWQPGLVLEGPNGLWVEADRMLVACMGSEDVVVIPKLPTHEENTPWVFTQGIGAGDGIFQVKPDTYLVSDWNGAIYWVAYQTEKRQLLNTKSQKIYAADICYIPQKRLLLVPTFFDNSLAAYYLKGNF